MCKLCGQCRKKDITWRSAQETYMDDHENLQEAKNEAVPYAPSPIFGRGGIWDCFVFCFSYFLYLICFSKIKFQTYSKKLKLKIWKKSRKNWRIKIDFTIGNSWFFLIFFVSKTLGEKLENPIVILIYFFNFGTSKNFKKIGKPYCNQRFFF